MVKEHILGLMDVVIKENLEITKRMVLGSIHGQMVHDMRANGRVIIKMGQEL